MSAKYPPIWSSFPGPLPYPTSLTCTREELGAHGILHVQQQQEHSLRSYSNDVSVLQIGAVDHDSMIVFFFSTWLPTPWVRSVSSLLEIKHRRNAGQSYLALRESSAPFLESCIQALSGRTLSDGNSRSRRFFSSTKLFCYGLNDRP